MYTHIYSLEEGPPFGRCYSACKLVPRNQQNTGGTTAKFPMQFLRHHSWEAGTVPANLLPETNNIQEASALGAILGTLLSPWAPSGASRAAFVDP